MLISYALYILKRVPLQSNKVQQWVMMMPKSLLGNKCLGEFCSAICILDMFSKTLVNQQQLIWGFCYAGCPTEASKTKAEGIHFCLPQVEEIEEIFTVWVSWYSHIFPSQIYFFAANHIQITKQWVVYILHMAILKVMPRHWPDGDTPHEWFYGGVGIWSETGPAFFWGPRSRLKTKLLAPNHIQPKK